MVTAEFVQYGNLHLGWGWLFLQTLKVEVLLAFLNDVLSLTRTT